MTAMKQSVNSANTQTAVLLETASANSSGRLKNA